MKKVLYQLLNAKKSVNMLVNGGFMQYNNVEEVLSS